ncbi:MAG: glycosyltransferase family 39 protein [Acidobacteriota bacterium]
MIDKKDAKFAGFILVAVFVVFANTLSGDFVYDDNRQIAANPLIRQSEFAGKALTSDVWAFKGDGTIAMSNYWRPTFTAACIALYRAFGANPVGWHLVNILLHGLVCMLAYFLMRRLGFDETLALFAGLIFAVHPVHTESVAWISGSPDILLAVFLLASLLLTFRWATSRNPLHLAAAVLSYCLALGSKEIGVLAFPLFFLTFLFAENESPKRAPDAVRRAAFRTLPFAAAAILFFIIRHQILGAYSQAAEDGASLATSLLSVPEIFLFYIGQIVFSISLGPNYPVRAVEAIGAFNFWIPMFAGAAVIAALLFAARRGGYRAWFGLALFTLLLAPVFNIGAFPQEQIVHDRYLYLPLLGLLIVAMPVLSEIAERIIGGRGQTIFYSAAALVCVVFSVQTFAYNRAWLSDMALWKHAVAIDAGSSFNWMQLGSALSVADRKNEALEAFERSMQIRQAPAVVVAHARLLVESNQNDAAIAELKSVLTTPLDKLNASTLYQAYDAIALAYQQSGQLGDAEKALREARQKLPIYSAGLTQKLAIILYLQNRKPEALAELESAKAQARKEFSPEAKSVFFRLGLLHAENGNAREAQSNLAEFLRLTADSGNAEILEERKQAAQALKSLR